MKLILFSLATIALAGCTATPTQPVRDRRQDGINTRVHTQAELQKTGRFQTGEALQEVDPAITLSGRGR